MVAPGTGMPRSSCTTPRIAPGASDATCMTGWGWGTLCAIAAFAVHRRTRPPTTDAVISSVPLICLPFLALGPTRARDAIPILRRAHREVDVPGQGLVRDLVGDLDLQPVVALGK